MRDAAKGVEVKCRKDLRGEISVEEEELLLAKELLGCNSAECLLNTIYFCNGKLFGLRSNEHRLIRVSNIAVKDNFIIFDQSVSKTFHGGLKDLKKSRRLIEHKYHEMGGEHSRCLVKFLLPSAARQHTILDTRLFLQSPLDPVFRASYVLSRSRSCVCLFVCKDVVIRGE
jgi:hypothetical protein